MSIFDRSRNVDGTFQKSHGCSKTKLYGVWCGMKERCNNPNNKRFDRYGGRGIKVCDDWNDFSTFQLWSIQNGYRDGLTIDRINNDGMYSPDNCRFVTRAEQNRNYSRNHLITYNGETKCIADWANETGIKASTLSIRLKRWNDLDKVFSRKDLRTL